VTDLDPGTGARAAAPGDAPVPVEPEFTGFRVRLDNFDGPFDLLLQLIGKHKLDVTEIALSKVTDEFIAYIRAAGDAWDLDEASEFLVVAATLLDLKTARLLPSAQVEDEEDLALLEARDLLFARLLQYKAFKEAAAHIQHAEATAARSYPRAVTLEPRYADALPELVLGVGAKRFAQLAARLLFPKPPPSVAIDHVHMVRVSVREHAAILRNRLLGAKVQSFRLLCADCQSLLEVVARFLALLELYREELVSFEQIEALGELTVRWIGPDDNDVELEIDEYLGRPEPEPDPDPAAPDAIEPARRKQAPVEVEPAAPGYDPAVIILEPAAPDAELAAVEFEPATPDAPAAAPEPAAVVSDWWETEGEIVAWEDDPEDPGPRKPRRARRFRRAKTVDSAQAASDQPAGGVEGQ
jgi:segregation and condensation protein A